MFSIYSVSQTNQQDLDRNISSLMASNLSDPGNRNDVIGLSAQTPRSDDKISRGKDRQDMIV